MNQPFTMHNENERRYVPRIALSARIPDGQGLSVSTGIFKRAMMILLCTEKNFHPPTESFFQSLRPLVTESFLLDIP